MPASYRIDSHLGVIFSVATGRLVDAELMQHQDNLVVDPGFRPDYRQLLDFTAATEIEVSTAVVRRLSERNMFARGAKRAVVVATPLGYGLARMFQMLREERGEEEIQVFYDLGEARRWLGLDG